MENEKDVQKKIFEIRILEEQIKQFENQIGMIDKEILELQTMQANLDEIKKIKQKNVVVPLGKNIFIDSKIENGDKVFINVGAKTMVKRSVNDAKQTLEKQKNKFFEAKEEIGLEANRIITELNKLDKEIMNMQK